MNYHDTVQAAGMEVTVALGEDYPDLRNTVRQICKGFPGEYWRKLDNQSGYPTEFVAALTEAGFLGALIPEEYGGSGLPLRAAAVILEEINANGCSASPAMTPACCTWPTTASRSARTTSTCTACRTRWPPTCRSMCRGSPGSHPPSSSAPASR